MSLLTMKPYRGVVRDRSCESFQKFLDGENSFCCYSYHRFYRKQQTLSICASSHTALSCSMFPLDCDSWIVSSGMPSTICSACQSYRRITFLQDAQRVLVEVVWDIGEGSLREPLAERFYEMILLTTLRSWRWSSIVCIQREIRVSWNGKVIHGKGVQHFASFEFRWTPASYWTKLGQAIWDEKDEDDE